MQSDNNQNKKQGGEEQLSKEEIFAKYFAINLDGSIRTDGEFIFKAMESYALQFQSKNLCVEGEKLYRWVKASERSPDKDYNYHTRVRSFNDNAYNSTTSFNINPKFKTKGWETKDQVIEWLEEYTQSKNNTDTEAAIRKAMYAGLCLGYDANANPDKFKEQIDTYISSLQGANGLVKEEGE